MKAPASFKPLRLVVDSRLRIGPADIERIGSTRLDELRKLCTYPNPAADEWRQHKRGKPPPAALTSARREPDGGWSFPRGRISELLEQLPGAVIDDRRNFAAAPRVAWQGPPARAYQARLIQDGLEHAKAWQPAGIWRCPQGSGKTNAVLELVGQLGLRALAVAPTDGVLGQWELRSAKLLGTKPGIIKGSKRTIGELITVASQKTLWYCVDQYAHLFGAVFIDEAQLGASRTYQMVIDRLPAAFRLAVSGHEHRADGKHVLIYDQFGERVLEVTHDEVLAAGGVVEVDVVIVPTAFEADWYRKLDYAGKYAKRDELMVKMSEDSARNQVAIDCARRCLAEGEQVVMLCERREHCARLDAALCLHAPSVLLMGSDPEFDANTAALASGKARAAVGTYKAIGVGFESHPELARGVFASPVASNEKGEMQFNQFLGRYARPAIGKRRARVYYLLDVRVYGTRHAKLIRRWCGKHRVSVLVDDTRVPINDWLKQKDRHDSQDAPEPTTGNYFGF